MIDASLLVIVAALGGVNVVGAEPLPGKGPKQYAADPSLTLEAAGPGFLVLDVRAEGQKPEKVLVTVVRDERFRSETQVAMKPNKKNAPKGFFIAGKLALELSEGSHRLVVSAPGRKLVVAAAIAKKAPKPIMAAPEVESAATPAPVAATESAPPAAPAPAATKEPPPAAAPTAPAPSASEALSEAMASSQAAVEAAANVDKVETEARGPRSAFRVAVYDFELSGVDPNIGAVVTDSMLAEVRKLQGVSAIGMDEIRDMLSHEANKQILGCESNESCLAEIAGALGVDDLVSGKLAKVDDGVVFLVRRIDQRRAKVAGVVNQRLKAESGEEFLAAIGPAVEQLFPDTPLRAGLERGVPKEMALRLDPPPLPTWAFYTSAGLTLVAGAAGGVFGLFARDAESSFQSRAHDALSTPIEGKELVQLGDKAKQNAKYANYSLIGAGALALTSVIVALFTDWYGYGDAHVEAGR